MEEQMSSSDDMKMPERPVVFDYRTVQEFYLKRYCFALDMETYANKMEALVGITKAKLKQALVTYGLAISVG
jgi:hypothetical protein